MGQPPVYDGLPKRRLFEVLKAQGLQMNQDLTFLSDGGATVRELQLYLSPESEHILDWFHVTMRITQLQQQVKGLASATRADCARDPAQVLESVKWYLWHGNVFRTLQELSWLADDVEAWGEMHQDAAKLAQRLWEFHDYIAGNRDWIPNYGERYRYGERIATGFTESAVNQVVRKRMVKQQQMETITKRGLAHWNAGTPPSCSARRRVLLSMLLRKDGVTLSTCGGCSAALAEL